MEIRMSARNMVHSSAVKIDSSSERETNVSKSGNMAAQPTPSIHPYVSELTAHAVVYVLGPESIAPQGVRRPSGRRQWRGRPE